VSATLSSTFPGIHRPAVACALAGLLLLLLAASASAQDPATEPAQGLLPETAFEAGFRKFVLAKNTFSPYYSWDADMGVDLTVYRKRRGGLQFFSIFQTVGTSNLGAKIGVGGTGYVIRVAYVRQVSQRLDVSAGLTHLSSHFTRDLDAKTAERRAAGEAVPDVEDLQEYNAVFVRALARFREARFRPEVEAILQPINLRLNGHLGKYVRPLYVKTRFVLGQPRGTAIVLETRHEVGRRPFNWFSLGWEPLARTRAGDRLQLYFAGSPGHRVHSSPNVGALRDGLAFGIRMRFRSPS
jgi:hypothetical protein